MAQVEIQPSNQVLPGSHELPQISFPSVPDKAASSSDPHGVVSKWTSDFNELVRAGETDVSGLFLSESYWRDLLCLSWDFHTFHGPKSISSFVSGLSSGWRIKSVHIDASSEFKEPKNAPLDLPGQIQGIQSFVAVETDVGRGGGLVRLLPDSDGVWKCYTLFTSLQGLTGHDELINGRRPKGADHVSHPGRRNWKEQRKAEESLNGPEPTVLIVGSGQAGLTVAARLKQLGIRSLIVDRIARVGDNWRKRYHHLVLHDSVWFDHMPYLSFPAHWPVFTPKDKLADWFESYAKILELNIWTSTTIKTSTWDEKKRLWTVSLERELDGSSKNYTIQPHHVILATGASGKPLIPSIPGASSFQGDRLIHSSVFPGLPNDADGRGKNIIIVGSGNSAHDIAQDYHEHGYNATIVQRSSTYVISSQTLTEVITGGLYREGGPPVEDADIVNHSLPWPVLKRFHIDSTKECTKRDADLLAGLQKARFKLDSGPDGAGLWTKYLSRGGGYYIDTGASSLIASGAIKVKPCSIASINAHSITFEDGEELPADEIIYATGFGNMRQMTGEIFGEEVRSKVGDVWGFDEQGETRGMWRRSGHEGFWFFGGNLALCRFYSRLLALQIKGLEEGMYRYGDP